MSSQGRDDEDTGRRARRLRRPGWKDVRLITGVLLVVLSVAGGARLISSLDDSTEVYLAAEELIPGQRIGAADLEVAQVRLGDQQTAYLDGSAPLAQDTHVLRFVAAGELVPADAVGSASDGLDRAVTVPVDPASAQQLSTGDRVDVWMSPPDPEAVGSGYLDPELLLTGALIESTPSGSSGIGPNLGSASVQVVVPAERVGDVIAAVDQQARLTLVPSPGAEGSR